MRTLISEDPYSAWESQASWNKKGIWPCHWVSCPESVNPGVVAYRLLFSMPFTSEIRVHVSAVERYDLFVDGKRVGRGSERGDGDHWFFETYDLVLEAGTHTLVARVWSLGDRAPFAQMQAGMGSVPCPSSFLSSFLLSPQEKALIPLVGTGKAAWEAKALHGYRFLDPIAAWGTGDNVLIDGNGFDWGYEKGEGAGWRPVLVGREGSTNRRNDRPAGPVLEPATLPPMLDRLWQAGTVRLTAVLPCVSKEAILSDGTKSVKFTCGLPVHQVDDVAAEREAWGALLKGQRALTIPPHTCRRVLIDLENYVCAYPRLVTTGGAGSLVRLHWQESLFNEANTRSKGNRDAIENKYFVTIWHACDGIGDAFLPDGGASRVFETLWWQCGRYVEIVVQTEADPLTLESLTFHETRYPLEPESQFAASDVRLADVQPLMVRALQMCAHETYMDCPYYEQLMYVGDTRLEVLATYALTRDSRLPRKALRLFDRSRRLDGLTQSRYPTRVFQSIPPFSLWWVAMIHDFARWQNDIAFVRSLMPGARGVVDHYVRLIDDNDLLHAPEGWNFIDWVPDWKDGTPPGGQNSVSGPITWKLVWILRLLGELETLAGEPELAARAHRLGSRLAGRANDVFWSETEGLFADDLDHQHFSEHSQCLALLGGMVEATKQQRIANRLLASSPSPTIPTPSQAGASEEAATVGAMTEAKAEAKAAPPVALARTTIYFTHYLFETYHLLGRTDKILERMDLWFDLAAQGLKTTVEMPSPTRSDCHAWGAHPLYHYFASILGIRPASMGFRSVRIAPDLGPLTHACGTFPHPLGDIVVDLHREEAGLAGTVVLPAGLRGAFAQQGTLMPLRVGHNVISSAKKESD